jgi:hypothetical protein
MDDNQRDGRSRARANRGDLDWSKINGYRAGAAALEFTILCAA